MNQHPDNTGDQYGQYGPQQGQPGGYGYGQPYGQPQYGPVGGYAPGKPDNNLVWAILSTLLCCMPFGIVSIVYAAKVDGLWAQGAHAEAQEAARQAKKWAIISAASLAIVLVLYFAFIFVVLVAGTSTTSGY